MFEGAQWQDDRMVLNGLLFRLEHNRSEHWNDADRHFRFFKTKPLIDDYERFFSKYRGPKERVLELGLWDGGSLVFWFETLNPTKIAGIDIEDRQDSEYLRSYLDERKLRNRISTYWNTNQ